MSSFGEQVEGRQACQSHNIERFRVSGRVILLFSLITYISLSICMIWHVITENFGSSCSVSTHDTTAKCVRLVPFEVPRWQRRGGQMWSAEPLLVGGGQRTPMVPQTTIVWRSWGPSDRSSFTGEGVALSHGPSMAIGGLVMVPLWCRAAEVGVSYVWLPRPMILGSMFENICATDNTVASSECRASGSFKTNWFLIVLVQIPGLRLIILVREPVEWMESGTQGCRTLVWMEEKHVGLFVPQAMPMFCAFLCSMCIILPWP